jgi:hypothetical protein
LHFANSEREGIVEAFAYQPRRFGGGVFWGDPADYLAQATETIRGLLFRTKRVLRISKPHYGSSRIRIMSPFLTVSTIVPE